MTTQHERDEQQMIDYGRRMRTRAEDAEAKLEAYTRGMADERNEKLQTEGPTTFTETLEEAVRQKLGMTIDAESVKVLAHTFRQLEAELGRPIVLQFPDEMKESGASG